MWFLGHSNGIPKVKKNMHMFNCMAYAAKLHE